MQIQFHNYPQPRKFDDVLLPKDQPVFLSYVPDFELMEQIAVKYQKYKNILVIGHGGSVSSFYGIYNALHPSLALPLKGRESEADNFFPAGKVGWGDKCVYFLSTIDPDYIAELKAQLIPKHTIVLAISKSGEDTTQLEALSQFWDFPILVITEENTSLYHIAQKKNLDIVIHPQIGGRYTGLTEVSLLPALLCGLDAENIFQGGRVLYQRFGGDNSAFQLASCLYQLEQKGIVDVFVPIYSRYLFNFNWLISQLCHESFGKNGLGQTFICLEGPEWQHHTLQRVLDGRKNAAVVLVWQQNFNVTAASDFSSVGEIDLRGSKLSDISGKSLANSMTHEREAVAQELAAAGVPVIDVLLNKVDSNNVGQFLAFWQLFAIYSSLLRQVNPFDQPAVEESKNLAFKKRLEYKQ